MTGADDNRRPLSVVVVDDDADMRLLLRISIDHESDMHVVGEATNGVEAVALAERLKPDALVLDLTMPRMDGRQTIPAIVEVSPFTRVVVLSGHAGAAAEEAVLALGAAGYLEKGRATDLPGALRRAVGRLPPG